jgi:hypothetical protein
MSGISARRQSGWAVPAATQPANPGIGTVARGSTVRALAPRCSGLPRGAAILPPVQRFTEHARRLQQAVTDARQGRTGVVMIGALIRRCLTSCRGLMRTAQQNYPQLSLSVTEMQSADDLAAAQSGEIDIARHGLTNTLRHSTFARLSTIISYLCLRSITLLPSSAA